MIEFRVKMEAPSTPNLREHWAKRAKRTKAQRNAVTRKMPAWTGGPLLHVRLTRVAPRALDGDNCATALKGCRDSVASRLRIDDASPLVEWHYAQAKGEAEVVVQIWRTDEDALPLPVGKVEPKQAKSSAKDGYIPPRSKPVVFAPPEIDCRMDPETCCCVDHCILRNSR